MPLQPKQICDPIRAMIADRMITIRRCETKQDYASTGDLLGELSNWDSSETEKLGFKAQSVLDFYYDAEKGRPSASERHLGLHLLGYVGPDVSGCISYREVEPTICEMKHLYVRPSARGSGLGRALVSCLLARARAAGYKQMRLETVSFMAAAVHMYESMGFIRRSPYYVIPDIFLPITIFMEKDLDAR